MQCKQCNTGFEMTDRDRKFYKEMDVSEPTLCPDCRKQRQLAWRNERNLYKRKCDLTGESIISIYSSDKPYKVFSQKEWWGDRWDPLSYGREFDFSRPFFEQWYELHLEVPRPSLLNTKSENSDYTVHSSCNRNCYYCCDIANCEDIYYSNWILESKNVIDSTRLIQGELCYECLDSEHLFNCLFCQSCKNCSESAILFDCHNCQNCIGCVNLRSKKYYLFNEPSDKQTIEEFRKNLSDHATLEKILKRFGDLKLQLPHFFMHAVQSENVSGEYVEKSKDVYNSYYVYDSRDCNFATESAEMKDCYDVHSGWVTERCYEFHAGIRNVHCLFTHLSYDTNDLFYCDHIFNSERCFGCVGLNQKKNCILNKQYSKEEYDQLIRKIIEHMRSTSEFGEFYPIQMSPFAYNESMAHQYWPLTKEKAKKHNNWKEMVIEQPQVEKTIPACRLPDSIDEIPDDIVNWAVECEVTQKPFLIIPQELRFYRENLIPIPRLHPEERYRQRIGKRNPWNLWDRQCAKCNATIKSTYAPDRPEIVYCEDCYLKEVY